MVNPLKFPYSRYRVYFVRYQFIASALVCLPIFLSLFLLGLGVPHFLFVLFNAIHGKKSSSVERKLFHLVQFLYYVFLLYLSLTLFNDILGPWSHADTIDKLIQGQMFILPGIILLQLLFLAGEWFYPNLKPHEILELENQALSGHRHCGDELNPTSL